MLFFAAGNADSLWGQMKMEQTIRLQWQGVAEQHFASDTLLYMDLESGVYEDIMPVFYQSFPIYDDAVKVEVMCLEVKAEALTEAEMKVARNYACARAIRLCSQCVSYPSVKKAINTRS